MGLGFSSRGTDAAAVCLFNIAPAPSLVSFDFCLNFRTCNVSRNPNARVPPPTREGLANAAPSHVRFSFSEKKKKLLERPSQHFFRFLFFFFSILNLNLGVHAAAKNKTLPNFE